MKRISTRSWYLLTTGIVLAVSALYLVGAARCNGFGFPLDDGWIHQTYARNLAQKGQLAYGSGQASMGSTSLLWTLLLALGYVLHVAPVLWAYTLGIASWLLVGWTSASLTRRLFPRHRTVAPWVGLACLLEWHLAWAALSGMETMLFTFLSLLLIERYAAGVRPLWLGLIGGLLVLARPEGLVLVGLLGAVVLLDQFSFRRWRLAWDNGLSALVDMVAGVALLLLPYVILNEVVSGQPLPNAFYAKQAEYRALLAQPQLIWVRLWIVLRRPLVGGQALLIPGFVWGAIAGFRGLRNAVAGNVPSCVTDQPQRPPSVESPSVFLILLPIIWWIVHHVIYAFRLAVDYQYGRYLMPTIPVLILYGTIGTFRWLQPRHSRLLVRAFSKAMVLAIGCLFVAFLLLGRQAYAGDLCIINGEMVDVALWLQTNTPPDALVATHDIGAIGYFAQRPLLDLAGLVTPEIIPMIGDEAQLLEFMVQRDADYVVAFPSWYREMVRDDRLVLVYRTDCQVTREKGTDNMAVYRIHR